MEMKYVKTSKTNVIRHIIFILFSKKLFLARLAA